MRAPERLTGPIADYRRGRISELFGHSEQEYRRFAPRKNRKSLSCPICNCRKNGRASSRTASRSRLLGVHQHEQDPARLGSVIDPCMIGGLLHDRIAGLEMDQVSSSIMSISPDNTTA